MSVETTVIGPNYPGNETGRYCIVGAVDLATSYMIDAAPIVLAQWGSAAEATLDNIARLRAVKAWDFKVYVQWTLTCIPLELAEMLTNEMRVATMGDPTNTENGGDE